MPVTVNALTLALAVYFRNEMVETIVHANPKITSISRAPLPKIVYTMRFVSNIPKELYRSIIVFLAILKTIDGGLVTL